MLVGEEPLLIKAVFLLGNLTDLGFRLRISLLQRILKIDRDLILRVPESTSQTLSRRLIMSPLPSYQRGRLQQNRVLKFLKERILFKSKNFLANVHWVMFRFIRGTKISLWAL